MSGVSTEVVRAPECGALADVCVCVEWLCAVGWLKRLSTALLLLTARSILAWVRKFGGGGCSQQMHGHMHMMCGLVCSLLGPLCVSGHYWPRTRIKPQLARDWLWLDAAKCAC